MHDARCSIGSTWSHVTTATPSSRSTPRRASHRPGLRRRVCAAAATLALGAQGAACSPAEDSTQVSCRDAVGRAAAASEPDDELRLLDQGLAVCDSYEGFASELAKYPGVIGYSVETFIERRCRAVIPDDVLAAPTCLTANPPTTPPTTVVEELLFVGATLDGRLIEIRPTPETPFIDDVPTEIQRTVDITLTDGCEGLRSQRDLWVAAVDGSPEGDIASVFAQHAQNVAMFTGCDIGTFQATVATADSSADIVVP